MEQTKFIKRFLEVIENSTKLVTSREVQRNENVSIPGMFPEEDRVRGPLELMYMKIKRAFSEYQTAIDTGDLEAIRDELQDIRNYSAFAEVLLEMAVEEKK